MYVVTVVELGQSHLSENIDSIHQQRASGDNKVSADDVRVTGSAAGKNIVAENIKERKSEVKMLTCDFLI